MRALARGGASSARAARAPRTRRAPPRRLAAARPRAASSGDDAAESGWRTLGGTTASSREDSGWIAVQDEPSVSSPEEDYERDFSVRVVYRPRGYYYDAVRASDAGERVKVDVGVVDKRRARTYDASAAWAFAPPMPRDVMSQLANSVSSSGHVPIQSQTQLSCGQFCIAQFCTHHASE